MNKRNKLILSFALVVILLIVIIVILTEEPSDSVSTSAKTIDKNLLVGNWLRTDSDYRLQISEVNEDFTLEAKYFNPNPINVGRASWQETYGSLKIIIELRDVNYPGSTYTLNYLPDKNLLAGDYYQAVEGLTFYVEFTPNK